MAKRSAAAGEALAHAVSTSSDPFAATRGVEALVIGCTVHRVGCPLLEDEASVFFNYHFCLRCVSCVPRPPELLFVNATDTALLVHADPNCFFVDNSGGQAALVCQHCFGTMPPEVAANFVSAQAAGRAAASHSQKASEQEPSASAGFGAAAPSSSSSMP